MDSYASDLCYILASTKEPFVQEGGGLYNAPPQIYNGIYTGVRYYRCDTTAQLDSIINFYNEQGQIESIFGVFSVPKWLAPYPTPQPEDRRVAESNTPFTYINIVNKQSSLNGYTPKNNKLKCYPYNYLLLSNNIGQNEILHYEKFSDSSCNFSVYGVLNPRLFYKYYSNEL